MIFSILNIFLMLHVLMIPLYLYLTWNFNYWRKRGLRTAFPVTIFGTFPSVITRNRNLIFEMHYVYLRYRRCNRAIGIFITRKPEFLVLDPKLAREIFITNFRHFHDTNRLQWNKYSDRNKFHCAGEKWRICQINNTLALTLPSLEYSYSIWLNNSKKLTKFLAEELGNGANAIETMQFSKRFAVDIICKFIWSFDSGNESYNILKLLDNSISRRRNIIIYQLMTSILPHASTTSWPFQLYAEETKALFRKLTHNALKVYRKEHRNNEFSSSYFLKHLNKLDERNNLNQNDLLAHVLEYYEAAGSTLMHTLFYLARYSQIQEKLRAEIFSNLKKQENEKCGITFEDLMRLPYLDQCVYETLRLVTLLPHYSRTCTNAITVQVSPKKLIQIPEGMVVIMSAYSIHHDECYFPDPNSYTPERFNNEKHKKLISDGVFLPFGIGLHICGGSNLVLLTVKAALVEILTKFEIKTCARTQYYGKSNAVSFLLNLNDNLWLEYKKL